VVVGALCPFDGGRGGHHAHLMGRGWGGHLGIVPVSWRGCGCGACSMEGAWVALGLGQ